MVTTLIESGSGLGSGSRVWMTKTEEKKMTDLIKNSIYLCPSYRRSLPPSKENIQHCKKRNLLSFFYVFGSFLPSWIQIQGPIESRSTALAFYVLPGSVHLVLLLLMEGAIFGREFPVGFLQAQLLGVNGQHLCLLLLLGMLWNQLVLKYGF
jgi:hypothetical protein